MCGGGGDMVALESRCPCVVWTGQGANIGGQHQRGQAQQAASRRPADSSQQPAAGGGQQGGYMCDYESQEDKQACDTQRRNRRAARRAEGICSLSGSAFHRAMCSRASSILQGGRGAGGGGRAAFKTVANAELSTT